MTTTPAIYLRPSDHAAALVTIESDPKGQAMWVVHPTPGSREKTIRQFHESLVWLYEDTSINRERARRIEQAYKRISRLQVGIEKMRLEMEQFVVPEGDNHTEKSSE